MGWRDRDWAKFDDEEWGDLVRAPAPIRSKPRRKVAVASSSLFVAVAASAAATFLLHIGHADRLPAVRTSDSHVVGVRWRAADLMPAASAGRVCITDPKRGQFCASYAIGEKPADALTRQLAASGLSVRSSG